MKPILLLILIALTVPPVVPGQTNIEVFVSPAGNDDNAGTELSPYKTITKARDVIASYDTATITLLKGMYNVTSTIAFTSSHSNLTIKGQGTHNTTIYGGYQLKYSESTRCDNNDIALGIDSRYASKIRKWTFASIGITDTTMYTLADAKSFVVPQLYSAGEPITMAQIPENGFDTLDSLVYTGLIDADRGDSSLFIYRTDINLNKIHNEKNNAFLHGTWFFPFRDFYELIDTVDVAMNVIKAKKPRNYFGYKERTKYRIMNLLSQIDRQGEYAIDFNNRVIYAWVCDCAYTGGSKDGVLTFASCNNVVIKDVAFANARNSVISAASCTTFTVQKCLVKNVMASGGMAVYISGRSVNTKIVESTFRNIGQTAIQVTGNAAMRRALGLNKLVIANNDISLFGTVAQQYRPAVQITDIVGANISHNTIYNSSHSAILFYSSNSTVIANNHIYDVCKNTGDAGTIYHWRDWTSRGNIIRENYIYNCGYGKDVSGVYMDDLTCGVSIINNYIKKVGQGIKPGGGRDHIITGNTVDSASNYWIYFDARGLTWAKWLTLPPSGFSYVLLTYVNYTGSVWGTAYPKLRYILSDSSHYPKENVIKNNIIRWGSTAHIDQRVITYGLVDSNIVYQSSSSPTFSYGKKAGLDYDTMLIDTLIPSKLLPVVKRAYTSNDSVYIITMHTYYSDSLLAKITNSGTGVSVRGSGTDTIKFSGLSGSYNYYIWFKGMAYQDSTVFTTGALNL